MKAAISVLVLMTFTRHSLACTSNGHGGWDGDISDSKELYDNKDSSWPLYLGSLDFIDFWCGVPHSSYIENADANAADDDQWARRRRRDDKDDIVDLNTYRLDHSFVFYRNNCYEFGPGRELIYSLGSVGRDWTKCPVTWTDIGRSSCSTDQATELASWYQDMYDYNLLFNNCHHFAEWLLQKLTTNVCTL